MELLRRFYLIQNVINTILVIVLYYDPNTITLIALLVSFTINNYVHNKNIELMSKLIEIIEQTTAIIEKDLENMIEIAGDKVHQKNAGDEMHRK